MPDGKGDSGWFLSNNQLYVIMSNSSVGNDLLELIQQDFYTNYIHVGLRWLISILFGATYH